MTANVARRIGSSLGVATGAVCLVLLVGLRSPLPQATVAAQESGVLTTTLQDQNDLALTVYNSNIALVRDVRTVRLPAGVFDLRFMDIAASVNPATVHLRSMVDPTTLRVLEQNYEYDLLEPEKLLRKYVGRDLTLVRTTDGTTVETPARLLAYNNGPVWQIGDEIVTGFTPDHMRFPSLPDNLYSRPTLVWTLDNAGGSEQRVETSYLAAGLSWNADYVLTVGRSSNTSDLDGWVTLDNRSGTAFPNASLQLVAGELNRVQQPLVRRAQRADVAMAAAEASFLEETFSEYHLYTLGRRTSVMDNESKQLSLLTGGNIPTSKRFVVDGQSLYYRNRQSPGAPIRDAVKVFYEFRNDAASGLGLPMPAGVVRVYQADSNGRVQFAGEDRIGHTPKDESVRIHVGNAFDVVAERVQTSFERIADGVSEMEFSVTIRNHKDEPIVVDVNERFGGTWTIRDTTHQATRTSAWAAQFAVPVDAGASSVLRYRVRVTW